MRQRVSDEMIDDGMENIVRPANMTSFYSVNKGGGVTNGLLPSVVMISGFRRQLEEWIPWKP